MNNYCTSTLIKKLRMNYHYTIQKVASILGVSKAAVSKWENADDITTEHLYALSKLYNVSFTELYYGRLNNEDSNDYWRRNYDLSNFEIDEGINNKNVDKLKCLFEHCNMVKKKFFELLPRWAKDELSNNEIEEFEFIKRYFKFDSKYYAYIKFGPRQIALTNEKTEKEFINETINKILSLDKERYMWELTKLYNFTYDYKSNKICESGNLKALEYMLMSFSQIQKDSILYANLHIKEDKEVESLFGGKEKQKIERDRTEEEIENIPFFKTIINSGANVLYQGKSFHNGWDSEMLDKIEGHAIKMDNSIYNKYQFCDFSGQHLIPVLNNWKLFTYDDYLEFVDKNKTNHLRDVVNLKESDPLKFYENMIRRNNINAS